MKIVCHHRKMKCRKVLCWEESLQFFDIFFCFQTCQLFEYTYFHHVKEIRTRSQHETVTVAAVTAIAEKKRIVTLSEQKTESEEWANEKQWYELEHANCEQNKKVCTDFVCCWGIYSFWFVCALALAFYVCIYISIGWSAWL